MYYLILLSSIILIAYQIKQLNSYLHIIQLEGYKNNQYLKFLKTNYINRQKSDLLFSFFSFVTVVIVFLVLGFDYAFNLFLVLITIYLLFRIIKFPKINPKKKMIFTNRLTRLIMLNLIFILFESYILILIILPILINNTMIALSMIMILLLILIVPVNVYLSNLILLPIEKIRQNMYKNNAKKIINSFKNLKIIGLTGSYGKTSTKHFLNTILSEKFNVLMTPESYNTPMGICKIIRNQLKKEHDIFIAEMGARYIGDINEICSFVNPQIGIITSIGEQHLETFKSIQNIAKTKFELIESLPKDGFGVINLDDEQSRMLMNNYDKRFITFGIENQQVDVYATDISYSNEGTKFNVNLKDGRKILCNAKVLGIHNIYNILASISTALELKLEIEEIKNGIEKLQPVEHRLQIMPTNNGITVIDDAFNSNPVGSKMALDVLKTFVGGNKVIVTPGMVELGSKEYEYNKEFGINIAKVCNYAILVGPKRTKPIYDGLIQEGFDEQNILIVNSLNEASQKIAGIVKQGDIVLFENDLPDNYNE